MLSSAASVDSSRVKLAHRNPYIGSGRSSNSSARFIRFLQPPHQQAMKMIFSVRSSEVAGGVPPLPAPPSSGGAKLPSWKMWAMGVVLSIMVPSFRYKLWTTFKDRVDTAVETVEMMTDIVEDVAEKVEKLADDIGNHLPEGELKDALEKLEEVADRLERSAELAGDVIDKVQKVGDDVESFIKSSAQVRQTSVVASIQSVIDARRP